MVGILALAVEGRPLPEPLDQLGELLGRAAYLNIRSGEAWMSVA